MLVVFDGGNKSLTKIKKKNVSSIYTASVESTPEESETF